MSGDVIRYWKFNQAAHHEKPMDYFWDTVSGIYSSWDTDPLFSHCSSSRNSVGGFREKFHMEDWVDPWLWLVHRSVTNEPIAVNINTNKFAKSACALNWLGKNHRRVASTLQDVQGLKIRTVNGRLMNKKQVIVWQFISSPYHYIPV